MIINFINFIILNLILIIKIGFVIGGIKFIIYDYKKIFDKNLFLGEKADLLCWKIIYGGFYGLIIGLVIFIFIPLLIGYYLFYKLKKLI